MATQRIVLLTQQSQLIVNPFQILITKIRKFDLLWIDAISQNNFSLDNFPAGNCMFKVNNRNTKTRCEIRSKLIIKTPERRQSLSS